MNEQDSRALMFLIIVVFLLAGALLYFLGTIAILLGFAGVVVGALLMFFAQQNVDEETFKIGLLVFCLSLVIVLAGFGIKNFFDNTDVGVSWLNSSRSFIGSFTR